MPPAAFSGHPLPSKKLDRVSANTPDGLCLSAWEEVLQDDFDRDFILNGNKKWVFMFDEEALPAPVECGNQKSAQPGSPLYEKATSQVLKEMQTGHYEVVSDPPIIVSPIGVLQKPEGGVRPVHDCSLPEGQSVDDHCSSDWHQRFSRIDDAAALVTDGCYMAKVDLQAAYRHVILSNHSKQVTGTKWQFGRQTVYLRASASEASLRQVFFIGLPRR